MKASNLNTRMQGTAGSFGLLFLLPTPDEYKNKGNYSTQEELTEHRSSQHHCKNGQEPRSSGDIKRPGKK
jgi:hypothetical protein